METLPNRVNKKLNNLVSALDKAVTENIDAMSYDEINFIIENHAKNLKYDLVRYFEEAKEKHLNESPFGGIMDNG